MSEPYEDAGVGPDHIRVGAECLLSVMQQHFMVEITEVDADTVTTTFPARDYPVEGMTADLEFHDRRGIDLYRCEVLAGPRNRPGSVILRRPKACARARHRDACRVPTDLTVQVRDRNHVRRYDAALLNLSLGGALLSTEAPFASESRIELTVSLPAEPTHEIPARVVHLTEISDRRPKPLSSGPEHVIGARFLNLDPAVAESISRYIWGRLRELYPHC